MKTIATRLKTAIATTSTLLGALLLNPSAQALMEGDQTRVPTIETHLKSAQGFSGGKAYTIPSEVTFKHRMALTLVINKNSRWMSREGQEQISKDIQSTIDMYAQCQVSVSPITVIETTHENLDTNQCDYDYAVTYFLPEEVIPRPMALYVNESINCTNNKQVDTTSVAYSTYPLMAEWGGLKVSSKATLFIAQKRLDLLANDSAYQRGGQYTLGHELGHILMDDGKHISAPGNVMHDSLSERGQKLSPGQCEKIRSSSYVKPL